MTAIAHSPILVAEDDPGIVEVIKIILEEEGYQVFFASSKKEVETLAAEKKPQVIFLDILLGEDRGQDIAHILQSQPTTKHIPIILLSANPDIAGIAKEAGVKDYLQKPFEIDDLLAKIKQYS